MRIKNLTMILFFFLIASSFMVICLDERCEATGNEIFVDDKAGLLQLTLFDGEVHEISIDKMKNYRRIKFPKQINTIPIPDMVLQRSSSDFRGDREQSAKMMMQDIKRNEELIAERNTNLNKFIMSHIQKYYSTISSRRYPTKS